MSGGTLALSVTILGVLWIVLPWSLPKAANAPDNDGLASIADLRAQSSAESVVDPALMKLGKSVYEKTCSKCHQSNGRGLPGAFPPLADNTNLKKLELIVTTVKSGHSGQIAIDGREFNGQMPAMGAELDNKEVAAVATYIRNSWGNKFGGVTQKEVADIVSRSKSSPR